MYVHVLCKYTIQGCIYTTLTCIIILYMHMYNTYTHVYIHTHMHEITEGSRVAMNTRQYHQTVPLDDLCEMPQKENREQHALYDQPPENDAEYAEVSRQKVYVATDPTSASPETYWKFDNPLYERN